jgi:hypothetical protein
MSKSSDLVIRVLIALLFDSSTFNRLFNVLAALASGEYLQGFVGLAGAEEDFLGLCLLGDNVEFKSDIVELRLLMLDLVVTLEEIEQFNPDIGLFLLELLHRISFSKDLRAESKTSFKSKLC